MKKLKIILIVAVSCIITLFIYGLATAFDPVYDNAQIDQNIGGTLICNSEFMPSIHSSPNRVSYLYQHNGQIIDLGSGSYTRRQWKKNEQLIKLNNLLILKTGGERESDKLIIGTINLSKWDEYEFTSENIERDEVWKSKNINSLSNYCCSEIYISQIKDGIIKLNYKFRIDENQADQYDVRKIIYKIDRNTGKVVMINVY